MNGDELAERKRLRENRYMSILSWADRLGETDPILANQIREVIRSRRRAEKNASSPTSKEDQ